MKSLDADKKANKTSEETPAETAKPAEKIDFSNVKIEPLFEETVDFDTFSKSDFRAVKVKEFFLCNVVISNPSGVFINTLKEFAVDRDILIWRK